MEPVGLEASGRIGTKRRVAIEEEQGLGSGEVRDGGVERAPVGLAAAGRARGILEEHRGLLERIASDLEEQGYLAGAAVEATIRESFARPDPAPPRKDTVTVDARQAAE